MCNKWLIVGEMDYTVSTMWSNKQQRGIALCFARNVGNEDNYS